MFGGQCIKALGLGAIGCHRLFDQNMDPASKGRRGQLEMGRRGRTNMKNVDLFSLQCVFQASTGTRTSETPRETPRRTIVNIEYCSDFTADARNIFRMPKAHQTSSRNRSAYFH